MKEYFEIYIGNETICFVEVFEIEQRPNMGTSWR